MNKNEEIEKLKNVLMDKIKLENDSRYNNLSSDEVMKIIINSSNKGKYVLWVLREYLKGNIQRFEDIESRVKQALILFKNNLSKFSEQEKQLNKISFQKLENLVEPYQDVLTQNEIKRMNKEKIYSETSIIYDGPEGKIYIPKTKEASIFFGQGTKWCTAAADNNMFGHYNKQGPLYIIVLPEKDEKGREEKYQLHFESGQFMDSADKEVSCVCSDMQKLIDKIFDSFCIKEKIKNMISNDLFFDFFGNKTEFEDVSENILLEKIKLGHSPRFLKKIPVSIEFQEIASKKNGYAFHCIPDHMKTYELCKIAVEKHGWVLESIPFHMRTYELCELSVKNDGTALEHVPENLITPELCELAILADGLALRHIPEKYMNYDFCVLAVKQNGMTLSFVPEKFITKELCEIAIKQREEALEYVPRLLSTEIRVERGKKTMVASELCKLALKQNGLILPIIPLELMTDELCKIAVEQNVNALQHIPAENRTNELLSFAFEKNTMALQYFPKKMITEELCAIAVERDGVNFHYVPAKYATKELCYNLIKRGFSLQHIPDNMKTHELCEIAVKMDGRQILQVPEKFKTPELCEMAVRERVDALDYIPQESQTKKLCEIAIEEFNNKNKLNHSFGEAVKMMFDLNENAVKEYFNFVTGCFEKYYIDIVLDEITLEIQNNLKKIM